jgi:octaprenyl-diphosphate synthase
MHFDKIAVLVGDYLLSKGLLLSIDHGDFAIYFVLFLSLCAK